MQSTYAPLKAKHIFTDILYSINSEFSFIQLLVHQKRASLYQDLPWLQRRLVVTIRVNTMTSLSHCHLCFCPGSWNQTLSQLYSKSLDATASPSPSPSCHPTTPLPILIAFSTCASILSTAPSPHQVSTHSLGNLVYF